MTIAPCPMQRSRRLLYQVIANPRKRMSYTAHSTAISYAPAKHCSSGQRGPSWDGGALQAILVAVAALSAAHDIHLTMPADALLRANTLTVFRSTRLQAAELLILQVVLFILQCQLQLSSRAFAALPWQIQSRIASTGMNGISRVIDVERSREDEEHYN